MVDALGYPDASGVRTGFASRLLRAGLRAPEARSPMGARTLAGLIGLLTAEGADPEVGAWLAPAPGRDASFDVLTGPDGDTGPAVAAPSHDGTEAPGLTGLDVGRALREASRLANAGPGRVTVVSVGEDGLRRTVLERDPSGPFRFIYPEASAFEGNPGAIQAAVDEWAAVTAERDAAGAGGAAPIQSAAALAEAVREALGDVMVEVDMVAVEQMVSDALTTALAASSRQAQGGSEGPSGWAGQAALVAAADQFHVVLESFNDRIRAGSRSLQSLADELAAQERSTAAYTDQLAKSVQASIDRLLRRLDKRFDELRRAVESSRNHDASRSPGADGAG